MEEVNKYSYSEVRTQQALPQTQQPVATQSYSQTSVSVQNTQPVAKQEVTKKVERVEHIEPIVSERRLWNAHNVFLAVFLGILAIATEFIGIYFFGLDRMSALILGAFLITIYAIILFFLLEPALLREIRHTEVKTLEHPPQIKTVEKPVIKYIDRPVVQTIEKPVIKEVVRTVEKQVPVYKYIDRPGKTIERKIIQRVPVVKRVFVTRLKPRKKLNIKIYDYLGSSETMTYHKHGCRFSKLIKQKYRVNNDSATWFRNHKYKPCEVCIKKSVKV